jgi:hypothetical protein
MAPTQSVHVKLNAGTGEPRGAWSEQSQAFRPHPNLAAPFRRQGLPAPPKADRKTRVILQHDRDVRARLKAEGGLSDSGECRPAPGTGGAGALPTRPQRPP